MADEIIKELWKIKDDIAEEFGYDVKVFVSKLRADVMISDVCKSSDGLICWGCFGTET